MKVKKLIIFLICVAAICSFAVSCGEEGEAESVSVTESSGGTTSADASGTITFSEKSLALALGETRKVEIASMPTGATPLWSVSDESVVSVDNAGNVTALSIGEATVYAEIGEYDKASCVVTVAQRLDPVYSVTLGTADTQIYVGQTLTVAATVRYGDKVVSGAAITWTSSDESVAAVDGSGRITAKAAGEATITATYAGGGTSAESKCNVKVINK